MVIVALLSLLVVSGVLNVRQWQRTRVLEEKVWFAKWRLSAFAAVTSALVNEKGHFTRDEITSSNLIGYPYRSGDDYVLDLDPKVPTGIKYVFDQNGKFVRWEEYPRVRILRDDGTGRMVERPLRDVVEDPDSEP
jgi:hypothetical protein